MKPYAVYGHFYDATQCRPDGAQYLHLLRRHHPAARSLLEIACGTGSHLAALAAHYDVEGLDNSRTMLSYARKRLPRVALHCQDMAGFSLKGRFDAIVCPYDSINHLLGFRDWRRTFRAAKRHLNPKGVFIFDVNTEYRLRSLSRSPPWAKGFGDNYLIMTISMTPSDIAEWDTKVFERERASSYRLHHEVIRERAFAHERVKRVRSTARSGGIDTVSDWGSWNRCSRTCAARIDSTGSVIAAGAR